jgi:hypothetical protein
MIYRKFRADRLFDGYNLRDDDAVLITAEDGKIEAIVPVEEAGDNIEQLQGILYPGWLIAIATWS